MTLLMPTVHRRAFLSLLIALMLLLPTAAQETTAPRYRVLALKEGLSADSCRLEFEYLVSNIGAASTQETVVQLTALGQQDVMLDSSPVPALPTGGQGATVNLSAPTSNFPPNTNQTFQVRVLLNGADAFGASPRTVSLSIPPVPENCRAATGKAAVPFTIPIINYTLDLANPTRDELLLGAGLAFVLLLFILILFRLRRLLFGRPPAFGTHLPPYATTPPIDPYSQNGIRQSWQPYAQNNTITQPSVRGTNAVVKQLLGADGQYLNGWTITALRLSQYDQYGRVARTYTPGPLNVVRAINRLAHSRKSLDADQLERRVMPLARQLIRQLMKRITPRSAVLPVALDLRLKGHHGEVSIVFELYQSDGQQWHLLDRWQPEMTVVGKTIYETYTYTIHGQSGGESYKDFRARLPLDLARLLSELIAPRVRMPATAPMPSPATSAGQQPRVMVTPEQPMPPVAPLGSAADGESKG
jgi:hypothetical protein